VRQDSIFSSQIKRIHEYKRQLLNALGAIALYFRIKDNPELEFTPRTFIFAEKPLQVIIWQNLSSNLSII